MEAPTRSRIATLLPPAAGLAVAAIIAASTSAFPHFFISWRELLGFAVERIFFVSLAGVMVTAALVALVSGPSKLDRDLLALSSRAAAWLVPLAFFIRTRSFWTTILAAAFAFIVTPAFRSPNDHLPDPGDALFTSLLAHTIPLLPRYNPQISIAAALAAQFGVLAVSGGYPLSGALLIGASVAVWSVRFTPSSISPNSNATRFQSQTLLIATLAVAFTISALIPHLRGGKFGGLFGSTVQQGRYHLRALAAAPRSAHEQALADSANPTSEGNTGIVLWPLKEEHRNLIAPTPIDENAMHARGRSSGPLMIPFDGVYWFFKAPDLRPPRTSKQAKASPETVDIRSTDRRPLSIEAHDYLGSLIDLRCCSRIQIAIRNADRYPDTVSLELVLINTSLPNQPSQSLGEMMVKSTRPWKIYEKQQPVSETLNFPIPGSSSLHRFDEVKIIFRLDRARADAGARVAIDHFVLVPRGL